MSIESNKQILKQDGKKVLVRVVSSEVTEKGLMFDTYHEIWTDEDLMCTSNPETTQKYCRQYKGKSDAEMKDLFRDIK